MLTPRLGRCECAARVLSDARLAPIVLGSTPTMYDDPGSVTVKFVEGSQVSLTGREFEYLDDLNLFYIARSTPEDVARLYDVMARSPIVDTVYYNPSPSLPRGRVLESEVKYSFRR